MHTHSFSMALKHRKLHPSFTSTNDTGTCSDYCYPDCSDACFPVYNYIPPPPPPTLDGGQLKSSINLQTAIVVSVALLFFLVFIFIVKACKKQTLGPQTAERAMVAEEEGILLNEVMADNPIWYISTIGLQQAVINSISICKYKKNDGLIEGAECSVCLSEFQENEILRLLPKCSHAFHVSCIDTWLRSHTNCPLCRSIIVSDSAVASETMIGGLTGRENNGDPRVNEETQIEENSGGGNESGHNSEVTDNEDATRTTHVGDERIAKEEEEEEDGEEQVRKTKVSMDSSSSESFEV